VDAVTEKDGDGDGACGKRRCVGAKSESTWRRYGCPTDVKSLSNFLDPKHPKDQHILRTFALLSIVMPRESQAKLEELRVTVGSLLDTTDGAPFPSSLTSSTAGTDSATTVAVPRQHDEGGGAFLSLLPDRKLMVATSSNEMEIDINIDDGGGGDAASTGGYCRGGGSRKDKNEDAEHETESTSIQFAGATAMCQRFYELQGVVVIGAKEQNACHKKGAYGIQWNAQVVEAARPANGGEWIYK
jgi:hypothetical protein